MTFHLISETDRIRFQGVRFQTPSSVSFFGLTEFRGPNSVSSFRPIICVQTRTHRVSCRTHRVCRRTQWVLFSETVLSKQYSARSPSLWAVETKNRAIVITETLARVIAAVRSTTVTLIFFSLLFGFPSFSAFKEFLFFASFFCLSPFFQGF